MDPCSHPASPAHRPAPPRPRPRLLARAVAVLVASLACGCGEGGRREPRLVVLYAPCSVSVEFLSPYAPEVPYTPNLQAFADDALVFARHNTEAGQSGTDYAALFNSTHAYRHGVYCHPKVLDDRLYQISEAYADAGYETFFWSGHAMGAWNLGYGQGVERRNAFLNKFHDQGIDGYTANDDRFHAILDRLQEDPDYKAFVQVNFTLTHSPYYKGMTPQMLSDFARDYPAELRGIDAETLNRNIALLDGNGERNRLELQWDFDEAVVKFDLDDAGVRELVAVQEFTYKVKIHLLDRVFGKHLDSIREHGLYDDTLISFTADHGEVFYRDNADFKWVHGEQLAPEVLHIPWILRGPGQGVVPGVFEGVTRSIDVFPTMAGLSAIAVFAENVEGEDLTGAALGDHASIPELVAFSHTTTIEGKHLETHKDNPLVELYYPEPDPRHLWVRFRQGDMVYKHRNLDGETWAYQAFDLSTDPEERNDLFDPREHAWAVEKIDAYKALLVRGYDEAIVGDVSDEESLEALQGLGYAGQEGEER